MVIIIIVHVVSIIDIMLRDLLPIYHPGVETSVSVLVKMCHLVGETSHSTLAIIVYIMTL